jgi:hypothetical protein
MAQALSIHAMVAFMQWIFALLIAIKRRSGQAARRRNFGFQLPVYLLQQLQAYRQAYEICRS